MAPRTSVLLAGGLGNVFLLDSTRASYLSRGGQSPESPGRPLSKSYARSSVGRAALGGHPRCAGHGRQGAREPRPRPAFALAQSRACSRTLPPAPGAASRPLAARRPSGWRGRGPAKQGALPACLIDLGPGRPRGSAGRVPKAVPPAGGRTQARLARTGLGQPC